MKKIFTIAILLMIKLACFAQSGFYYQGVAKMKSGAPIAGQTISIYISILSTSPDELFYKESHSVKTDDEGRFSIVVGEGSSVQGQFSAVNWRSKEIWIQTEMDAGLGLEDMGKSRILPVPVATYALKVAYDYKIGVGFQNNFDNIFAVKQDQTTKGLYLGISSYMYDHEPVQITISNELPGLIIEPNSFIQSADDASRELTLTTSEDLELGIYNIPIKGKSVSGKVVSSELKIRVLSNSPSNYLVGKYKVADVIIGKTDTLFYEENLEAVGPDSIRFTNNTVLYEGRPLLNNSVAGIGNSGSNMTLMIKAEGPKGAADSYVFPGCCPMIISNPDEFTISYAIHIVAELNKQRQAIFKRIK